MTTPEDSRPGPGFALFGLVTGLATGAGVYAILQYWVDESTKQRLAPTALIAVAVFGAVLLLLAERGARLKAVLPAALVAALVAGPTYFLLVAADPNANLSEFPLFFWFFIAAPLAGFLLTTLAKATILDGAPPPYRSVFFHGLTLPLIAGGAKLFALLALVLIFAWAALLKAMNVDFFHKLFQEPWFMLPFLGGVGGLSIALMRGMESVLGALRFLLLLFCRIAMPITAVFSLTFIGVLAANGTDAIFSQPYPGAIMLGLAFAGMLIFNGVYQNGEGGPPALWLRLSTIVALATFPAYAGLAAYALWLRIGEYGLTPARIAGAAMNGLAALYSVVCLAGLLTELNWNGKRWMPLVAPFNTAMAALWIIVLLVLASPLVNPWALSAKSQELRLATGKVSADEFDFGYLRFKLGAYGEAALDRLEALHSHPEAAKIRAGVAKARAASNEWFYDFPDEAPVEAEAPSEAEASAPPGPMQLQLHPEGADLGDDDTPATEDQPEGDPQQ